jgi:hypothetical protein
VSVVGAGVADLESRVSSVETQITQLRQEFQRATAQAIAEGRETRHVMREHFRAVQDELQRLYDLVREAVAAK